MLGGGQARQVVSQLLGGSLRPDDVASLAGLVAGVMAFYCLVRRRSFLDLWAHLPLARIVVYGVFLLTGSWIYKYMTFAPP